MLIKIKNLQIRAAGSPLRGWIHIHIPQPWKIDTPEAPSIHPKLFRESFSPSGEEKDGGKKKGKQAAARQLFCGFARFTIATCCGIFDAPFPPLRFFPGGKKMPFISFRSGKCLGFVRSEGHLWNGKNGSGNGAQGAVKSLPSFQPKAGISCSRVSGARREEKNENCWNWLR